MIRIRRPGMDDAAGYMEVRAMLVLGRKKNEVIVINDTIEVMVVEIRGDKVRLGIRAPRDVTVHRREVAERIARERAA